METDAARNERTAWQIDSRPADIGSDRLDRCRSVRRLDYAQAVKHSPLVVEVYEMNVRSQGPGSFIGAGRPTAGASLG